MGCMGWIWIPGPHVKSWMWQHMPAIPEWGGEDRPVLMPASPDASQSRQSESSRCREGRDKEDSSPVGSDLWPLHVQVHTYMHIHVCNTHTCMHTHTHMYTEPVLVNVMAYSVLWSSTGILKKDLQFSLVQLHKNTFILVGAFQSQMGLIFLSTLGLSNFQTSYWPLWLPSKICKMGTIVLQKHSEEEMPRGGCKMFPIVSGILMVTMGLQLSVCSGLILGRS